jgi:hypothetical protein
LGSQERYPKQAIEYCKKDGKYEEFGTKIDKAN